MVQKRVLEPRRVRRVPRQFSWVDQQLLKERYLERCSAAAWGLYLFLVVVGDSQGLSYYSDAVTCRFLSITPDVLAKLRQQLLAINMIAYKKPLYQVLSLDPLGCRSDIRPKMGKPIAVAELLQHLVRGEQR